MDTSVCAGGGRTARGSRRLGGFAVQVGLLPSLGTRFESGPQAGCGPFEIRRLDWVLRNASPD